MTSLHIWANVQTPDISRGMRAWVLCYRARYLFRLPVRYWPSKFWLALERKLERWGVLDVSW